MLDLSIRQTASENIGRFFHFHYGVSTPYTKRPAHGATIVVGSLNGVTCLLRMQENSAKPFDYRTDKSGMAAKRPTTVYGAQQSVLAPILYLSSPHNSPVENVCLRDLLTVSKGELIRRDNPPRVLSLKSHRPRGPSVKNLE